MHTYLNAMHLELPVNPDEFLDADFQLENSEVVVKSVHAYGDDTTFDLPDDIRRALAQQIQGSLEFGY